MGGGVVKLLLRNPDKYERILGAPLELAVVADRSLKPSDVPGLPAKLITRDSAAAVTRADIDIVVELFGGHEPARALIMKALAAGKDVVTGNKALLAEHGGEIFREAGKRGLAVGFEASVGGGVPIIRTLREALAGDRQRAVYGIVNGTCNSILSTMTDNGVEFSAALADAQAKGLAEANPAVDVEGHDSAHKLCLLVTLAFGVLVKPAQIYTEGITKITQADIEYARELGCVIKLLAIGKDDDGAIEARVHPTMIPAASSARGRRRRVQRDLYPRRRAWRDNVLGAGRGRDAVGDGGDGGYTGNCAASAGRRIGAHACIWISDSPDEGRQCQADGRRGMRVLPAFRGAG